LTTDMNGDQRESAEAVRASAERLFIQIDHILDFSHLEAGFFVPANVVFEVRELAENLLAQAESCRGDKQITVFAPVDSTVPKQLRGDVTALRRAIWNLLENAVRFTDRGGVTLEIGSEPASEPNILLRCSIRDTGRGMSTEERGHLFDPFAQADNSLTRLHEGLGLGLATTKRLIERLHGRIAVESTPGRGTTFTLSVPLEIATPVATTAPAAS